MCIRGTTRVFGIFGDPVAHSLSPVMQNAAFEKARIDAVYVPFHVRPHQLAAAVAGLRSLGIAGLNVTVPHKEKVLDLLDDVDANARLIGAVNTILHRDGRLFGYNTDGVGLLEALRTELDFDPAGSRVLLLGAGGACRAAAVALCYAGAKRIDWVNRTAQRAQKLADEFSAHFPGTAFATYPWDFQEPSTFPAAALAEVDLVINTTTLGLKGERIALPWHLLSPQVRIYDMVYASEKTPLCEQAGLHGCRAADGLSMLVGQGEHAFRIWTGVPAPAGVMKNRLLAVLHDKKHPS
ncbi:hypothetical protein GSUB_04970 [Geoalkalibacter subterraneus]|uniref:Shikimate dehydrogenase (NADP(+)) n=1 Tax=Geoalkalibacter subterraneus TaxID=483547 RepID=A0A0B5FUQ4_9BACT|nr:hypothetical protein GSUB_04970 [Geoalkalibacter subterraneus]